MSSLTDALRGWPRGRATGPAAPDDTRDRTRRRVALLVTLVVLGWSVLELVNLGLTHTQGPELYGVLVAALAVGAGVVDVVLLRAPRTPALLTVAVLVLWAAIALGGVAGTVAHIVGPVPGDGPVDARPRPVAAPLVFTALGVVGGAALFIGRRPGARRAQGLGEE